MIYFKQFLLCPPVGLLMIHAQTCQSHKYSMYFLLYRKRKGSLEGGAFVDV